ncbi:fatty acid desaturase family protein [Neisseria mucosa]|uniref:fatty acid desaturase family protein n=1 Tax=Neisseria mucosa TaxID=488 RepID=UPI000D38609D|nr:fatty acid desaturase [Neisseria mucosa]
MGIVNLQDTFARGLFFQGIMYIGFIEAFHQAIHFKLVKNRKVNILLGTIIGSFFGTSFKSYQLFHMDHHKYCNTLKDPEILFYKIKDGSNAIVSCLKAPITLKKYTNIINNYGKTKNIEKILILSWHIFFILWIYLFGFLSFMKYIGGGFFVFFLFEYLIGQSQHYDKKIINNVLKNKEQSINIVLPYWLSFLVLFTNLHATHHLYPGCSWDKVYEKFKKEQDAKDLKFIDFILMWFRKGPKRLV